MSVSCHFSSYNRCHVCSRIECRRGLWWPAGERYLSPTHSPAGCSSFV